MIRKGGKQTPSDVNGKKGQKSQNNGMMMGSKTFIFSMGTAYDVSSMEGIGNLKSFSLMRKACLPK